MQIEILSLIISLLTATVTTGLAGYFTLRQVRVNAENEKERIRIEEKKIELESLLSSKVSPKDSLDLAPDLVKAATELLEPYRSTLEEYRTQVEEMTETNKRLVGEVSLLREEQFELLKAIKELIEITKEMGANWESQTEVLIRQIYRINNGHRPLLDMPQITESVRSFENKIHEKFGKYIN